MNDNHFRSIEINRIPDDNREPAVAQAISTAPPPAIPLWLVQLVKYGVAAAIALAVDVTSLHVGVEVLGLGVLPAAALAFCCGLATNYFFCIRWVFEERAVGDKRFEFAIFAFVGIIGLAITELILYLGAGLLSFDYRIVKLVSVGVVFFWNFAARRALLFSRNA